jgi:nitroreductase
MLKNLVRKNRTVRRFDETFRVEESALRELVDLARLSPSAANLQPLKYVLSCEPDKNGLIFPCLGWAGYLKEWPGPEPGERPSAYIVILLDTDIADTVECDHGIACQSIMLGAVEKGLGGAIIAAIDRVILASVLNIPAHLKILLVLALGKPVEQVVLEEMKSDGDVKYHRDENRVHHVPKRSLDDIIIG